jgi:hypothetical protein
MKFLHRDIEILEHLAPVCLKLPPLTAPAEISGDDAGGGSIMNSAFV